MFMLTEYKGRPTKYIDLLAELISNDKDDIKNVFSSICNIKYEDDGLAFNVEDVEVEDILIANKEEVDRMTSNIPKTIKGTFEKTREEGIEEGVKKGIEKGIEKGKIEVAKNLLSMGMNVLTVIKATGLSKEDIEKIKEGMN